ncbi:DUF2971 domain-containing protein [Alteromonas sp. KS69]|uniref:DUF2971 domain-containing protein n=1 Tax=Alteromonas sp. KS69 TaxID=2109917 RepID=UPI0021AF43F1|nr:DUF2971 domain-containing protein [Alteromonas sp. KS69]
MGSVALLGLYPTCYCSYVGVITRGNIRLLYKYLDPERIDVLSSSHIRFTQPADFNDPFEFRPVISSAISKDEMDAAIERELEKMVQEKIQNIPAVIRSQITPSQLESITRQLYKDHWPYLKEQFKKMGSEASRIFIDKANTLIGVLSLTESNNNILMWSHYARSHKGFCVGFDTNSDFFNRKRSDVDEFYHLREVKYDKARPNKLISQLNAVNMFLTKSIDWEYEKEWRMCSVLEDCDKTIDSKPYPIHLFKFPESAVKEVILGACMENSVKDNLLSLVRDKYAHISVKQAKVSSEEFSIGFVDL